MFAALCAAQTRTSTDIRVISARGLGAAVWWLATGLATVIPTSLVAVVCFRAAVAGRRRVSGRDSGDIKRTQKLSPAGQRMRRVWFGAILLWVALETIGATWMFSDDVRGSHTAVDTSVHSDAVDRRPLPPLPAVLPPKRPDEFLLVMMGGSTAGGDPYSPVHNNLYTSGFSFIEAVQMRLQQLFPKLRVESAKLALGGGTLEDAYRLLCRLRVHPDVIVVYSGHNELFTRFSPDDEAWEEDTSPAPDYGIARGLFPPSLLARCIEDRLKTFAVTALPPDRNRRRLFDRPLFTPAAAEQIYQRFRETLVEIVSFCRRQDIQPILIIPAANESGFDPSRSWLPVDFPEEKRQQLVAIYAQLDTDRPDEQTRVALLESAFELASEFAETCFRLGQEYENQGRFTDALRCYQSAIDCDGYPLRASSRFADIYRDVAERFDSHLIDARDVLRPLSANGILGDDLIHDNCHPNVVGYTALANATLHAVHELHGSDLNWPASFEELTPRDLVRYFMIDRAKWAEVFDFVGRDFSDNLSLLRYDPALRLRKGRAYRAAAAEIEMGTWQWNNGIPDSRVFSPAAAAP